ncbi:MAG: acetoin utilization protein AcuC [Candidatus Thorarchaeota archaeon]
MTNSVAMFYDERFIQYNFGSHHPLHQDRILLHHELARDLGLLSAPGVSEPSFDSATEEQLQYVHTQDYVTQIRTLSNRGERYILDGGDTSVFPGAYDITRLIVGASLAGCDAVMTGVSKHSWNPGGGLHHAHADSAAGFCIFNDVAIACHYLQRKYKTKRILYLDIDVHHGDGVQEQFYTDPSVLTLSIHQTGRTLFPNSGFTEELGEGEGRGYSVNLPLPPYTQDHQYLDAFEAIVPPIIETYKPDVMVMQNGVDTHFQDELGQLILTTQTFSQIANRVHQLAHQYSHGRLVAVGGGGYSYYSVPRCWTIILAQLAGFKLPDEIPKKWQTRFNQITGLEPPTHVFDKNAPHLSQLDEARIGRLVSQSVQRVKDLVFPLLSIEK